jgi:hypothetical protein
MFSHTYGTVPIKSLTVERFTPPLPIGWQRCEVPDSGLCDRAFGSVAIALQRRAPFLADKDPVLLLHVGEESLKRF